MSFISGSNITGALSSGLGFATSAGQSALGPSVPTGTSGAGIPTGKAYAIAAAASKYGVPISILVGVFGLETAFGTDHSTSSAGAVGDFQFLPSTAKSYGYPLVNNPDNAQFTQQADAAARYLSTLHKQTGDWNTALEHYSGNGYGLGQVQAKAKQAPSWLKGILGSTGFTNQTAPGKVQAAATDGITGVWNSLVGDAKYAAVLVGVLVLGVVLIVHGLSLSGGSDREPIPVPV
jgi:hypothetical protein